MANKIVKAKKAKEKNKSKYKLITMGNPVAGKIMGDTPMQREMKIKNNKY